MLQDGIREFVEFCHDEFWDLRVVPSDHGAWVGIHRADKRRDRLVAFLESVGEQVGCSVISESSGLYVVFDACGAAWPSTVFKVRTTFSNDAHRQAALDRDRRDCLEILALYASLGKSFKRKMLHPAIRRIQIALNEAGANLEEDGQWNWRTRLSLWWFRRRHHLSTPGFIDLATIEALEV